jgi:hypothetical protein
VQDPCSGCDSWAGIPVKRTPARAVDALRLGLRWLATSHVMRAHFTRCPNRPAGLPQVNSLDRRGKNSKAKRGTPAGPANAVRLALWLQTHGEGVARGLRSYGPEKVIWSEERRKSVV